MIYNNSMIDISMVHFLFTLDWIAHSINGLPVYSPENIEPYN